MGNICNNKYLEMAKLDYNHCQEIHQLEWRQIQEYVVIYLNHHILLNFVHFFGSLADVMYIYINLIGWIGLIEFLNRWCGHLRMEESLKEKVLYSYYEAAASIFEPERRNERVAWAKTMVILNMINHFFGRPQFINSDMQEFADNFSNPKGHDKDRKPWHMVLNALNKTLNQISSETLIVHGIDIHQNLHHAVSSS